MFFLNPANHIRFFSVILESDIDPGYIHWTLTLFQSEKSQLKFSQYVCYIIWESHFTKIVTARLLKLTVSKIHIEESVWHPNTEPRFFRTRFVKSYTSLEVDIPPKNSGRKTALNSSQTITMSVRPCPVLLKSQACFKVKMHHQVWDLSMKILLSQILPTPQKFRGKHFNQIATCIPWHHYGSHVHKQSW